MQIDLVDDAFMWAWNFATRMLKKELISEEYIPKYGITNSERNTFITYTFRFFVANKIIVKSIRKSEFNELSKKYPGFDKNDIIIVLMYRTLLAGILHDAMIRACENSLSFVTIDEVLSALSKVQQYSLPKVPYKTLYDAIQIELMKTSYTGLFMSERNGYYIS